MHSERIDFQKSSRGNGVGGSCLFDLVWFLTHIGPGFIQEGIEVPDVELRLYLNNLSLDGVTLVIVQSKDLIEWSASGRAFPH